MDEGDKTPFVITLENGQLTANIHLLYNLFETNSETFRPRASMEHSGENCANNVAVTNHPSLLSKQFIVVSVVGPPSCGKSFLINWIARYFSANGDDNWMEATGGDSVPLHGFSWSPFPDDLEMEASTHSGVTGGVRVLTDVSKLYQLDTDEDGSARVTKYATVILLDVDMPDKGNPEFRKHYLALTASCMLLSTLSIYIDGSGSGGVYQKAQEIYSPRLLMAVLDQFFSDADSSKPEILFMTNQHFSQPAQPVDSVEEFKQFCTAYEVAFTEHKLHALRKLNRRGQFLGALEHLNKPLLHLVLSRMASVPGLLSKPTQTPPDIFVLIQKILGKMNEILKPDFWADFTQNIVEYVGVTPSSSAAIPPSDSADDAVQTQITDAAAESVSQIPTAAPRHSLHQHRVAETLSLPARVTQDAKLDPTAEINCSEKVPQGSPKLEQKRGSMQAEVLREGAPIHAPEEPVNETQISAAPVEDVGVRDSETDSLETECDEPNVVLEEYECINEENSKDEESSNIEMEGRKQNGGTTVEQECLSAHPEVSAQDGFSVTQPETPDDGGRTQNEKKQEVEAYMWKNGMPVFQRLLSHYLQNFMASSMVRLDVVEQIGIFILDRVFDSKPHQYREFATNYFTGLLTAFLEERSYITEAIDKGRNLIDSEFDSEGYFTDGEIGLLVNRAKSFSLNGFKPKSEQHSIFFYECWTAMEHNAKSRNKRLREHEQDLNEKAIVSVLELYSGEVLEFVTKIDTDDNCIDPQKRMAGLNDELVQDCLKILSGVKKFWGETEKVKAKLMARMAEFYSRNIDPRVKAMEDKNRQPSVIQSGRDGKEGDTMQANSESQVTESTNHTSSKGPFSTPSSYSIRLSTTATDNVGQQAPAKIPPLIKERIPDSTQTQSSGLATAPTNPNAPVGSILVIHLGRDSIVRVVPVGQLSKEYPVQKIPAYIGVLDGDYCIGESVMNLSTAVRLQEHRAGHHRVTMLIGKTVQQLRYELLLGLFFAKCKEKVEDETGLHFNTCILAVPAMRTIIESEAIRDAAHLAGFTSIRLISELTAVAFDHHQQIKSATLEKRITRSNSKSKILVLYCARNGVKEMSLHVLSSTMPQVEMMAVTGTPFLGHISSTANWTGWARTPSEYQKFASEVTGAAKVHIHSDNVKLVLAGDNHDMVQQSAGVVDIQKIHGCLLTRLADESVIHGAMQLAKCVQAGENISALALDKVGIPVKMLLPSGFASTYLTLFEKNANMPGKISITLNLADFTRKELTFQLLNIELGIPMGTYTILITYPAEFPAPYCTYGVECAFVMRYNGIMEVGARLRQRGPRGTEFFPLDVTRGDSLNLTQDDLEECKSYVAYYVPTTPEGKAKYQARKELHENLDLLKNHLQELKSHRGSAWQTKSLEGEIYRATRTVQDSSTDLETLRSLLLTLRKLKLSPPREGSAKY